MSPYVKPVITNPSALAAKNVKFKIVMADLRFMINNNNIVKEVILNSNDITFELALDDVKGNHIPNNNIKDLI